MSGYESAFGNKKTKIKSKGDKYMDILSEDVVDKKEIKPVQKIKDSFKEINYLSEKDESQILLLNEILKRVISLEETIANMKLQESSSVQLSNRKIVVSRDDSGKIIGAEIVEGV